MAYNKREKLQDNIRAIRTAFVVEKEQRSATPEEKDILRMQLVAPVNSLTKDEKDIIGMIAGDLQSGNHLRFPRSEAYRQISAEYGVAVRTLRLGEPLSDRQRDMLLEHASSLYDGVRELAEELDISVDILRKALGLKISREDDLMHGLVERMRRAGIDVNTDWREGERVLVKENERVRTEAEKAQQEVIHSPEFKAWFGDWELASKEILVIKKNGTHDFNLSQRTSDLKKDVVSYAELHGIIGTMSDDETNHKGVVEITKSSIEKMVDDAVKAGDYKDDVFTALGSIRKLIKESVIGEIHEDHIKGADGVRRPENGSDPNIRIYRLYGAIDINGELYRAKTTIKETLSRDLRRAYTYELTSIELLNEKKIELLSGQTHSENISMSQPDNSISVAKLLKDVEKSHRPGEKLLVNSQILTEDGKPMVVYHGTGSYGFSTFEDPEKWNYDLDRVEKTGIYFSSDKENAVGYEDEEIAQELGRNTKRGVYPVYLNMRNPLVVDYQGAWWNGRKFSYEVLDQNNKVLKTFLDRSDADKYAITYQREHGYEPRINDIEIFSGMKLNSKYVSEAIEKGYDGVIFKNIKDSHIDNHYAKPSTTYVVFEPNQIKSVYNVGTYSREKNNIYEHRVTDENSLSRIVSGSISRAEVERAMDSKLVKYWLRDKDKHDDAYRRAFMLFGAGVVFLYDMAKFRLGIDNKFGVGSNANVFWDASDFLVDYMRTLKENGLSASIADKFDLSSGSEDWQKILSGEPLFTDEEMTEIQKHIKPKGYEQFCQIVAAFPEDHAIKAEMERIMNYENGDALTKALILYDIATKRLRAEYEGDERFYSRVRDFQRSDGTIYRPGSSSAVPKEGERELFRWSLKRDVSREILRMIATTPLSEKVPLLDMMPSALQRYLDTPSGEERLDYLRTLSDNDLDDLYLESHPDNKTVMRDVLTIMAERRGYIVDSSYQGSLAFNGAAPSGGYYGSTEERRQAWYDGDLEGCQTLADFVDAGIDISDLDQQLNNPNYVRNASSVRRESIHALRDAVNDGSRSVMMYRSVPSFVKEGSFRNGDWITPSKAYAIENAAIHGWGEDYRIIEQEVSFEALWWDGNDVAEWGYDDGLGYRYKNVQHNIKSDALITYDEKGNIIPPSQRFNERIDDIRYMLVPDSQLPVRVTGQMKQDVMEGQPMFFRNGEHQAYGFVHDEAIYIDPRIATAETPLHEYTHLWAEVLRQRNRQEWANIVQMMKDTPEVWNYVKKNYPHLKTDNQIADEALAQFSGKRGYQRLQELVDGKQDADTIMDKMMEALAKFWNHVAEFFGIHYTNKEEVADRILYDLLNEVNPLDYKLEVVEGLREQSEKQIESENFKEWFGNWQEDPENASKVIDEDGRPLVVEHGTHADFTEFSVDKIGGNIKDNGLFGAGFYFGTKAPAWLDDNKGSIQRAIKLHEVPELRDIFAKAVPTKEDIVVLSRWLKAHRNDSIVLYHGTDSSLPILQEGLKRTSMRTKRSLESGTGNVYLTSHLGFAKSFGGYAYPEHEDSITVYDVVVKVKDLHADKDQLKNHRMEGVDLGDSLAASLLVGHSATVKHDIPNYDLQPHNTYHVMKVYLDIKHPFEVSDGVRDIYTEIKEKLDTSAMRGLTLTGLNGQQMKVGEYIDVIKAVDDLIEHNPVAVNGQIVHDEELQAYHPKDRLQMWREHEISRISGMGALPMSWQVVISEQIGSHQFTAAAKQDGYDGVIVTRSEDYKEYVAFEPSQIKSATDNIGLFSRESNDIRYHFIGEKGAKNLDVSDGGNRLDMMRHAEQLESSGASAKDIKVVTGWERGADGQWRYEIYGSIDINMSGNMAWLLQHPEVTRHRELSTKAMDNQFGWHDAEPLTAEELEELKALDKLPVVRQYRAEVPQKNSDNFTLEDFVSAPELFAAYPEFKHIGVYTETMSPGAGGRYEDEKSWYGETYWRAITINKELLSQARDLYSATAINTVRDTFIHEMQHAIQGEEGFAKGGQPGMTIEPSVQMVASIKSEMSAITNNPDYVRWAEADKEYRIFVSKVDAVLQHEERNYDALTDLFARRDELQKVANMLYSVEVKEMDQRLVSLNKILRDGLTLTYEDYRRLASEAEARNVVTRSHYSPAIRRRTLASVTEDVVREEQIVSYEGGVSASVVNIKAAPSYLGSTLLQQEIEHIAGQNSKAIIGYEHPETHEYIFVGNNADILARFNGSFGKLFYNDDISRLSEFIIPMEIRKEQDKFTILSANLIKNGFVFAVIDAERVQELLRQPEVISYTEDDVALETEKSADTVSIHAPKVVSAAQLTLFSDDDFKDQPVSDDVTDEDVYEVLCDIERSHSHKDIFYDSDLLLDDDDFMKLCFSLSVIVKDHVKYSNWNSSENRQQMDDVLRKVFAEYNYPKEYVAEALPKLAELSGFTERATTDLGNIALPALSEGEHCYVERKYTETGSFCFVGGEHIESADDVAYIFKSLEDKAVENSFICMVKDGQPIVIHLGIGSNVGVLAPIENALVAFAELQPEKVWFVHNHPSGSLKVSTEDVGLQRRMEKMFGAAAEPGIIINTTSGKYVTYTGDRECNEAEISALTNDSRDVKVWSFDRQVFSKDWNPADSFVSISPLKVAQFVSSHRLGEHAKMNLLVVNNSGTVTGNVFLPWTDVKDACTREGAVLISRYVHQMSGTGCFLYGSEASMPEKQIKSMGYLSKILIGYGVRLFDVMSISNPDSYYSAMENGVLTSQSRESDLVLEPSLQDVIEESPQDEKVEKVAASQLSSEVSRRLSPEDREAGGALVDHLQSMGIKVSVDARENRRVLKAAEKDNSEAGKVRYMKTSSGESYGFTYKGEMHLDLRMIDAELPLHEYAHLWCQAMRRINPDNWQRTVDRIFEDSDILHFVIKHYPELTSKDDIAEEIIANYSGRRGAEKLQAEMQRMSGKDDSYKSRWNNIFQNVTKGIQDFWRHVGDSLNIEYKDVDDVCDQVLKDFAQKVSPVRKVEGWLKERDKVYADAVENDPDLAAQIFEEALRENIGNGITPFISVDGYRNKLDKLAHAVKEQNNREAIEQAADLMAPLVPQYSVLVPAPSHEGMATDMKALAEALSERTGMPVADVLKSEPRQSQYDVKMSTGKPISSEDLGIRMEGILPEGRMPVVIDNVVHSGNTAEACVKALGGGVVLALARATSQDRHVASLKSLEPIVYDKDGKLIPLSERFELKNKYLGKVMHMKAPEETSQQPFVVQGLENYDTEDICAYVENSVQEILDEQFADKDIFIKRVTIIGSRSRGEAHSDSDLDILLEYGGEDVKEDALFNVLHEAENLLEMEGITFDINPINEHYSLNTAAWLERDARWRASDRMKQINQINDISMNESLEKLLSEVLTEEGMRLDFRGGFMADDLNNRVNKDNLLVRTVKHTDAGLLVGDDTEGYLLVSRLSDNEQQFIHKLIREHQLVDLIGESNTLRFAGDSHLSYEVGEEKVSIDALKVSRSQLEFEGTIDRPSGELVPATLSGLSTGVMDQLYEHVRNLRASSLEQIDTLARDYRDIFLKASELKSDVASISHLYDELNALSQPVVEGSDPADIKAWVSKAKEAVASVSSEAAYGMELQTLNDLTDGKFFRFCSDVMNLSSDRADLLSHRISEVRAAYPIPLLDNLYTNTIKYYEENLPKDSIPSGLYDLLEANNGKDLMAWVAADTAYDEHLQMFRETLRNISVYDADTLMTMRKERHENVAREFEFSRLAPKTPLEGHYAMLMSYYYNNHSLLMPAEKSALQPLDNIDTAQELSRWASDVLTGNTMEKLAELPGNIRDEVAEFAFSVAECNDDDLSKVIEGIKNIGIVNDMRIEMLVDECDRLHEEDNEQRTIILRSKGTMVAFGDDALALSKVTGWSTIPVRVDEGKTIDVLPVSDDGISVLSEKDMSLRIVTAPADVRPMVGQLPTDALYALQTVDYTLSIAKHDDVSLEAYNLHIGDFKAKSLDFRPTGLDAVADNGDKLVIRDIPQNYYHPEGTLVVADYINGHRETIENALAAAKPLTYEPYDSSDSLPTIYDDFMLKKQSYPDEILMFRQKSFVETFGDDAEKLSKTLGIPLYERRVGNETVPFAMMNISDFMSLNDALTQNVHVANSETNDTRQAISEGLVRMSEQIVHDSAKQRLAAEVFRSGDDKFSLRLVDAKTLHQVSNVVELSSDEAGRYQEMTGPAAMSQRGDFVMEMADKYFGDVLHIAHEQEESAIVTKNITSRLEVLLPQEGDSLKVYRKPSPNMFDPRQFDEIGSIVRKDGRFLYLGDGDKSGGVDVVSAVKVPDTADFLYRQVLREEILRKIADGQTYYGMKSLGFSYVNDHTDVCNEHDVLLLSGKYYDKNTQHNIYDWLTCPCNILENLSSEIDERKALLAACDRFADLVKTVGQVDFDEPVIMKFRDDSWEYPVVSVKDVAATGVQSYYGNDERFVIEYRTDGGTNQMNPGLTVDMFNRLSDAIKQKTRRVEGNLSFSLDDEYVFEKDVEGSEVAYRRVHGWTHDGPALLYSNTDVNVYFYDSEKNTVENIDNPAGIDAYENRKGFFLVKSEDFDEAYRQLEEHDRVESESEKLVDKEKELVNLVGKGKEYKFSEPVVINVDDFVAKDVIDSITINNSGTIALYGRRIDESGASASFNLFDRDEYDLNDIDKVLDAVKWNINNTSHDDIIDKLSGLVDENQLMVLPVGVNVKTDDGQEVVCQDVAIRDGALFVTEGALEHKDGKDIAVKALSADVQQSIYRQLYGVLSSDTNIMAVITSNHVADAKEISAEYISVGDLKEVRMGIKPDRIEREAEDNVQELTPDQKAENLLRERLGKVFADKKDEIRFVHPLTYKVADDTKFNVLGIRAVSDGDDASYGVVLSDRAAVIDIHDFGYYNDINQAVATTQLSDNIGVGVSYLIPDGFEAKTVDGGSLTIDRIEVEEDGNMIVYAIPTGNDNEELSCYEGKDLALLSMESLDALIVKTNKVALHEIEKAVFSETTKIVLVQEQKDIASGKEVSQETIGELREAERQEEEMEDNIQSSDKELSPEKSALMQTLRAIAEFSGDKFEYDFRYDDKIDRVGLGEMPDTITIEKVTVENGKLSLYSEDMNMDIDNNTLSDEEVGRVNDMLVAVLAYVKSNQQAFSSGLNNEEQQVFDGHLARVMDALKSSKDEVGMLHRELTGILTEANRMAPVNVREFFTNLFKDINDENRAYLRDQWNKIEDLSGGSLRQMAWAIAYKMSDAQIRAINPLRDVSEQKQEKNNVQESSVAVRKLIKDLGLEYRPLTPRLPVVVDMSEDLGEDKKVFSHAMVTDNDILVYEHRDDAYDNRNGVSLSELPEDKQKDVLNVIKEEYGDEKRHVSVLIDVVQVPEYALSAIVNGDFSGIEDSEDEKDIRDFINRDDYRGALFVPRDEQASFIPFPAFGAATDCVTMDIIRTATIKQLREEMLDKRIYDRLAQLLPENGDKLVLKESFVIFKTNDEYNGEGIEAAIIKRASNPDYEQDVFVVGNENTGINTHRLLLDDLLMIDAALKEQSYEVLLQPDPMQESELQAASQDQVQYRISYGSDDRPGGVFGDIHVEMLVDTPYVTLEDAKGIADQFSGEARMMNDHIWGDFTRQEDAEKFTNGVIALNADRIVENRNIDNDVIASAKAILDNQRIFYAKAKGKPYGRHIVAATINGKNVSSRIKSADYKGYKAGKVTLDQLVSKYLGKYADNLSVGSAQEAEQVRREENHKQKEKDSSKKTTLPAAEVQKRLLIDALQPVGKEAFVNADGKHVPILLDGDKVKPFNALMMMLDSDAHEYTTNVYCTYDFVQKEGCHVLAGEKGLPFNFSEWNTYVNTYNDHDVITNEAYEQKPDEEKVLYKVLPSKVERRVFNIDQTSMSQDNPELYKRLLKEHQGFILPSVVTNEQVSPADVLVSFRTQHPDAVVLMCRGDNYEAYQDDATIVGSLANIEVTKSDLVYEDGQAVPVVSFSADKMKDVLPVLLNDGRRIALGSMDEPLGITDYYSKVDAIYNRIDQDARQLSQLEPNHVEVSSINRTMYDKTLDQLTLNDSRQAEPGKEYDRAADRLNSQLRVMAAFVGHESRLNVGASYVLPYSVNQYQRLVGELSSAVLMAQSGVSGKFSDLTTASLLDYWVRELREDPTLLDKLEVDVNHTVQCVEQLERGEVVHYSQLRNNAPDAVVRPKLYTISDTIASLPNAKEKTAVLIRNEKNTDAVVVLPAGASKSVDNEVEGLHKNHFVVALTRDGVSNIQFFNAGGSYALNQSNEYFADKAVQVVKMDQYNIVPLMSVDVKGEIARTTQKDIEKVVVFEDDTQHPVIYVKPEGEEDFACYLTPSDYQFYRESKNLQNFNDIRVSLGQKYYSMTQNHPMLKKDILIPRMQEIDMSRINYVSVTKDKFNTNSMVLCTSIDGQRQEPVALSKFDTQRFWLVEDKEAFKDALLSNMYHYLLEKGVIDKADLGHSPFHEGSDAPSHTAADAHPEDSSERQEEKSSRGVHL